MENFSLKPAEDTAAPCYQLTLQAINDLKALEVCDMARLKDPAGDFTTPSCGSLVVWNIFSRMRSKGFRFTLGVWGLRVCSLDVAFASATVRNRSQPFATVRNRPREDRMAVPMGSSAEVVIFGRFQTCRCFRFAWQAWHFVTFRRCSGNVSKVVFAWQAQYFCDVFRRCVAVFVAGVSTLDVSIAIFRGRAQHF